MAQVTWRLLDVNAGEYDDRLVDVPECTDAYNRFARRAVAELDDPDGTVPTEYPRPTKVELEVKRNVDNSFSRRFGGFVAGHNSTRQGTELEILSHDQWIKRAEAVFRSYTDTAISTIITDLIDAKTPLSIDEVSVVNDQSITRDYGGETLESVLDELAAISAGEEYGATDTAAFFFRPREERSSPRDFTPGEYLDVEFEEDGKREANQVTIYYGGSDGSAIQVNDPASQKELQDELGTDDPVVIPAPSKSYPEITTEAAAERKGNQILNDRSTIQTGELSTWEAFDVRPGDVTRVVDPEQDVDADFRVAEISYSWRSDETAVVVAENKPGVVDQLVAQSEEIQRLDNRAANSDATITRFENLSHEFFQDFELTVLKRTIPDDQFLWGELAGGWGDPRAGGGRWGDRRETDEEVLSTW